MSVREVQHRVALVTGAGSGIGRATAELLSSAGYSVALAGRREERLRETGSLLRGPWFAIGADLSVAREVEGMVDQTLARFGRIDALVNNAGSSDAATIAESSSEFITRVFALNAIAPAITIARAWPAMERRARNEGRGGVVVNVSSYATIDPFPTLYAYAAAKASVNLLAKSVANQGRELGIRGFAVAPGCVDTELLRKIVTEEQVPLARRLRPEDVARVIVDCVEGKRDGENGSVILVPSP